MADFPKSSTINASVLRKIKKPLIEKKRKTKINQSHDQLKITLLENVKNNKPQVSRLDKAEISETTAKDLHQLPKQNITSTEQRDDTLINGFKYGDEEGMRSIINYLNFANALTHDMKSRMESHLSSCIGEVNDAQSTVKYSRGNLAIRSPLGFPVKSSYFTPLHIDIPSSTQYIDIPSSTQYPSNTAMTPDSNGGLLMPIPGYPVIKTADPYSPYYYPTQQNDSCVCVTPTDDTILNQSSGDSSLNEQSSQGQDSSASRHSSNNVAGNTSVSSDTVWRPW